MLELICIENQTNKSKYKVTHAIVGMGDLEKKKTKQKWKILETGSHLFMPDPVPMPLFIFSKKNNNTKTS